MTTPHTSPAVLHLVTRRQLRGAEVFASQLASRLAARGCETVFASLYGPGDPPLEIDGIRTIDLAERPASGVSLRLLLRLRTLLESERFDIIQAHGSDTLKYSVLAVRSIRWPPLLVYRNISLGSHWLHGPMHRSWNRWLLSAADHVAAVSRLSARDLERHQRVPQGHMSVIPIGVEIPERLVPRTARDRLTALAKIQSDSEILVHVGSFSPEKNHLVLLERFRRIRDERPATKLALLGEGSLRPQVELRSAELGLRSSVRFLGARADAAELVGGADLLVLPSTVEGIPGVILEAASRAVPAVAHDVGAVSEAVLDGETGFLVPPKDSEAFVAQALRLLADGRLREKMGRAARAFVGKHFEMETVTDRFLDLYVKIWSDGHRAVK